MAKPKKFPEDIDLEVICYFLEEFADSVSDGHHFLLGRDDGGDVVVVSSNPDGDTYECDMGTADVIDGIRRLADFLESLQ